MARKIIILDRVGYPSDDAFRVAFWLDVPVARRPFYANAAFVSAVAGTQAPDVTEQAALEEGAVTEVVEVVSFLAGAKLTDIRQELIRRHTRIQAEVTDKNLWARYGTFWDGTAWTARGGA
jgi:hypothetical protein